MDDLTNNEVATLIISFFSLLASGVGILVAVRANAKANAISQQGNEIALLQAKETSHGRLAENLSAVEHRMEKPLKDLSETATLALTTMTNLIGEHDRQESNDKALRHVYYDCCKSVSSVLSKQIVWQGSTSLHRRLSSISKADDIVEEGQTIKPQLDFAMYFGPVHKRRGILRLLAAKVPVDSSQLEAELKNIYRNITKADAVRLFVRGRDLCERYTELLKEIKPLIASALEELSATARLIKYQRFKLDHSDELHREYKRIVCKLEFLQKCDLDTVRSTNERNVYNPISQVLYMGVILAIVSDNYWEL